MELMGSGELVTLGAFAGALLLVVLFSVLIANAYAERSLMLHAAAGVLALLVLFAFFDVASAPGGEAVALRPESAMLLLLSVCGFQLRELVSHAGALHRSLRWLMGASALLPLLALVGFLTGWNLLLPGTVLFAAAVVAVMLRAWPQSHPWVIWLGVAQGALLASVGWIALHPVLRGTAVLSVVSPTPVLAAGLSLWAAGTYLATVWRSRRLSETRLRIDGRNVTDPLTGLSTPLIFMDRIEAARSLLHRYGHPSVLVLAQIENLEHLAIGFGPEVAEAAVLEAASRIRRTLGEADVAARVSHARIAVLSEGISAAQGSSDVATRILVAGLKETLPEAPTEFLQFRMVVAGVPPGDAAPKRILLRMAALLEEQVRAGGERRILSVTAEELLAT